MTSIRIRLAVAVVATAMLVGAGTFLLIDSEEDSDVGESAPTLRTQVPTPSPTAQIPPATPTPQPTPNEGTATVQAEASPAAEIPPATPTAQPAAIEGGAIVGAQPLYIFTSPTSVILEKVGESAAFEVRGRYADGTEHAVPALTGSRVTFASDDRSVAEVDSRGLITAVSPGSTTIVVDYGGRTAGVPVIVYGDYVRVPPYDPQRVVEVTPGMKIVVNRVIIRTNGEEYDPDLAQQIATDYGGKIIAEWLNLEQFGLEVPIETLGQLETLLSRLDADPRVAGIELAFLYKLLDYHKELGSAVGFARVPEVSALIGGAGSQLATTDIAIIDADLSLSHESSLVTNAIALEFIGASIGVASGQDSPISGVSHGLAVASVIAGRHGVLRSAGVPYRLHFYSVGVDNQEPDATQVNDALDHIRGLGEEIDIVNMSLGYECTGEPDREFIPCGDEELRRIYAHRYPNTLFVTSAGNRRPDPSVDWLKYIAEVYEDLVTVPLDIITGSPEIPISLSTWDWETFLLKELEKGVKITIVWPDPSGIFPGGWAADSTNILSVGALDHYAWHESRDDKERALGYQPSNVDRSCVSVFGDGITIAAEGQHVTVLKTDESLTDGAPYSIGPGTSFSAPIVTGVAALLHSLLPSLTPAEIKQLLVDSARDVVVDRIRRPDCGEAEQATWKALDAEAAVDRLLDMSISATVRRNLTPEGVIPIDFEFEVLNPTPAGVDRLDFEVEVQNTGLRGWSFHVGAELTSPGGVRRVALQRPTRPLVVGRMDAVPVSIEGAEPGAWTVRAIVSRSQINDDGRKLVCSDGFDSTECLDEINFTIRVPATSTALTSTPTATPPTAAPENAAPSRAPAAGLVLNSVSAGADHNCGLRTDGTIVCWGRNDHGQASPPDGTFASVTSSGDHSCAIDHDEVVTCWGLAGGAVAVSPSGPFESVSAGGTHACAVREDGSSQCWGPDDGIWNPSESPPGPFTSLSAGWRRTCGVHEDGTLGCWGRIIPPGPPPAGMFTSVSVFGADHCAVRTDGSPVCWGTEGVGLTDPPEGSFDAVSAGPNRACGIQADGSAACWGTGTSDPLLTPEGLFASITLGQKHYCGLRTDGLVVCWGNNDHGQSIPPDSPFVSAHPGDGYFCGRRSDGWVACRTSDDPPFGSSPLRFVPSVSFVDVSSARQWSCGVRTSGELACWGYTADSGRLGPPPAGSFRKVSISSDHACALAADGSIACWGSNGSGESNAPPGSFESVHVGFDYSCGLRTDGAAVCWGNGIEGDAAVIEGTFTSIDVGGILGCGLRENQAIDCWHGGDRPTRQADPSDRFMSVTVGSGFMCVLLDDGNPSCWPIGNPQTQLTVPEGQFSYIEAHSESSHVCGVRPDGSVKCWVAAP